MILRGNCMQSKTEIDKCNKFKEKEEEKYREYYGRKGGFFPCQ